MPATSQSRLARAAMRRPLGGLPPPAPPASAAPERLAAMLRGSSHRLYDEDVRRAYGTAAPGATCVMAAINDGSSDDADDGGDDVEDANAGHEVVAYPRVQINDCADANRLLRDHVQKPSFPYQTVLVGRGLLGQGDTRAWRAQRRWLRPAFQARHVASLLPLILAETRALVAHVRAAAELDRPSDGAARPYDVLEALRATTFRMVGQLMLGEKSDWLDRRSETLRAAFAEGLQPHFAGTAAGAKAARTMRAFSDAAFARWRKRRSAEAAASTTARVTGVAPPTTLLSRLLAEDAASPYADDPDLQHDELMTIMFAGHETTAHTLAWCLYELSRHPAQQRRVYADVEAQVARMGGRPPLEWTRLRDFRQVHGVTMALRETLRLWPVVANGPFRETDGSAPDARARGLDGAAASLPGPMAFQVPHWTLHRHPALWPHGEEVGGASPPNEFDLDRPGNAKAWNAAAFMPFSRPPRDCIGRHVALMEMQVLLTALLYEYELAWPACGAAKRGHNWATLVPEDGLTLLWRRRRRHERGEGGNHGGLPSPASARPAAPHAATADVYACSRL